MGSSFSLVLFGPDRPGLESAAAAAFAEAHRLDRLLSNYLAESEWSAMNREAALRPVRGTPELLASETDPDLIRLKKLAKHIADADLAAPTPAAAESVPNTNDLDGLSHASLT